MIKVKLLKKFKQKKLYFRYSAGVFIFLITLAMFSCFLITSCENDGFFRQLQLQVQEKELVNESEETDITRQDDPLPPKDINVYIDSLIDYKDRNIILKELKKSIKDYNFMSAAENTLSDQSQESGGKETEHASKYSGIVQVYDKDSADIVFKIVSGDQMELAAAGPFYYAAVTSFYSLVEDISSDNLNQYWSGIKTTFNDIEGNDTEMSLALGRQVFDIMENIAGDCNAQNLNIIGRADIETAIKTNIISRTSGSGSYSSKDKKGGNGTDDNSEKLVNADEENSNNAGSAVMQVISIVSFDDIKPYHKVLKIDGINLLDKNTEEVAIGASKKNSNSGAKTPIKYIRDYPLVFAIGADFKDDDIDEALASLINKNIAEAIPSNRSSDNLTSVMMTGVTALTRQVAARMDEKGILYPAEKIRDVLLDADITHISNEVSFIPGCFAARPNTMVFCSKPEYIELLKYIDADVIELTGNHINDYGSQWLDYSIDIYDREGIPYFGGGRNLEDALKPALFEIDGYKFAFLGANPAGPSYAWATESTAGSAPINTLSDELIEKDMQQYEETIKVLKSRGYIVIFTFQYFESYSYAPTGRQAADFERMINAGADIVSGSQAHQPQGFKISDDGFICFGLGNIFFGQALGKEVKQGIIAKHIFYKGKHINTQLITTFIEDFSQPRLTTDSERADLLKSVFKGSE